MQLIARPYTIPKTKYKIDTEVRELEALRCNILHYSIEFNGVLERCSQYKEVKYDKFLNYHILSGVYTLIERKIAHCEAYGKIDTTLSLDFIQLTMVAKRLPMYTQSYNMELQRIFDKIWQVALRFSHIN